MRKIGAMNFRRLLACMLSLALLLTALPAYAGTMAGWENVEVSVVYADEVGQLWMAPAAPVPQELGVGYAWWVTLPQEAMNTPLQLQIVQPDTAYTYWLNDWTLDLYWGEDKNATSLDDLFAYYVGYSYGGSVQTSQMDEFGKLYLSTMEPPFAYEADRDDTGAVMLMPGWDEGFGSDPGAELITPGTDYVTPDVEFITPGGQQGGYAEPATGVVTVYYKHVNGKTLDVKDVTLPVGVHTLWPESDKVGGLNLTGDYPHTVTVYDGGYTDVASITFLYEDAYVAPAEATIEVHYYHQDGYELDMQTLVLGEGMHTVYPDSVHVTGYELVSDAAVQVKVNANGETDLASVSFIYRDAYVAPVTGEVTVMYVLEDGTRIDTQSVTVAQGNQTVYPESRKVEGLTLVSDAAVNVYVDNGGTVSPNPVQFVYRRAVQQPTTANVVVCIYDSYQNEIAARREYTLPEGTHMIEAPAGNELPGWSLISEAVLYVTVHSDGSYSPSGEELSFWYTQAQEEEDAELIVPVAPPVTEAPVSQTATITLRYRDSRGYAIADDQSVTLGNGTHSVTPDYSHVPAGYAIMAGTESHQVTVRNGRANQSVVTFYFNQVQMPATPSVFDVTVYYYDTRNNEIAPRQTLRLAPGTHWVQASPQNLPAGYTLAGESAFELTVYADGTMDRAAADVGFWYTKAQVQTKNAVITVRYVDSNGRTIAGPFTQELAGGQTYLVSPDASAVSEAYDLSAAAPVTVNVTVEGHASPSVVSFVAELRRDPQDIPVGVQINRYGVVNASSVALRSEPYSTKSNTVLQRVQKGGVVYVVSSERNTAGEIWSLVIVNGRTGYMKSEFIDMLTMAASDVYAASTGATPVPTFTPEPTESIIEFITPVPVTPTPYVGYALILQQTGLRTGTGSGEMIQKWLPTEELVIVSETVTNGYTGENWAFVRTLDNLTGYVPVSNLRQVSEAEAAWRMEYWQQQNATPAPTRLVTNTPEPMQQQGYGLTTANNVPLRRMASESSRIVDNLPYGTVVYITGQTYVDGMAWQNVAVDGESGYIRSDLVRLMTEREETDYLATFNTPAPLITPTSNPYDENGLSSFGYVTTDKVNFRAGASTGSRVLSVLNRYAMATVLGTQQVGREVWYHVTYDSQTGYIHGDYFHQMTLREFSEFYGSEKYRQGLANNGSGSGNGGYTGTGGQVSQEDQVVDDWYASGNVPQPSFAPFLPVGTPEPIATATPTLEPLPGYVTQATRTPTPTPVVGYGQVGDSSSDLPLPGGTGSATYPMQESKGGNAVVWIVVILLLTLAIGGAVVVMQHQRRKQQIAMRAAQRRAQQARQAGNTGRPYARQAYAPPVRTDSYPPYGEHKPLPRFPQEIKRDAYGSGYVQRETDTSDELRTPPMPVMNPRPYARQNPPPESSQPNMPRVGRRTARQQELARQQDDADEV